LILRALPGRPHRLATVPPGGHSRQADRLTRMTSRKAVTDRDLNTSANRRCARLGDQDQVARYRCRWGCSTRVVARRRCRRSARTGWTVPGAWRRSAFPRPVPGPCRLAWCDDREHGVRCRIGRRCRWREVDVVDGLLSRESCVGEALAGLLFEAVTVSGGHRD